MKEQTLSTTFLILVAFLFCFAVLPLLSAQIPIHWNAEGAIDNWCDKLFLFLFPVLQFIITIGSQSIRSTDPRRKNVEHSVFTCNVFLVVLCLLIFGMCLITAISAWRPDALDIPMAITPGLGFLFTVMSNLIPRTRQNYFIGIKTPWTLEDEDNRRRIHRMAERLWFVAGLLMMLLNALPKEILTGSIFGLVSAMILVPYTYSCSLFRSKRMKGENK